MSVSDCLNLQLKRGGVPESCMVMGFSIITLITVVQSEPFRKINKYS